MGVLGEALRYARRDLLRVALAGSCVGIGSMVLVTALAAVGELNASVGQLLRGLGKNVLVVTERGVALRTVAETRARPRRRRPVEEDVRRVEKRLTDPVLRTTPRVVRIRDIQAGSEPVHSAFVVGVNERFPELIDIAVADGRFFSRWEMESGAAVAVVGPTLARAAAANRASGTMTLDGRVYRVIGVFEERGTFLGQDLDKWAVVPVSALGRIEPAEQEVLLGFGASTDILAAQQDVIDALKRAPPLSGGDAADLEVLNQGTVIDFWSGLMRGVLTMAAGVSAIVLLVSAVGVMNILLVCVDERIADIGIHKAVGATQYQVLWLFIFESIVMVTAGGVAGMTAASGVAGLLRSLDVTAPRPDWGVYAIAWTVVAVIGIVAGFYPALRGARLTVVDCLRAGRL